MATGAKQKYLYGIIIGAAILLGALMLVGYFFAKEASKPLYTSKIDQIMFDKKDKSPKYIITLLDRDKVTRTVPVKQQQKAETAAAAVPAAGNKPGEPGKPAGNAAFDLETLLKGVPNIRDFPVRENNRSLRELKPVSNLVEEKDDLYLPKIGSNGEKPWIRYSREIKTMTPPDYFKIAVVIDNLGLDTAMTEKLSQSAPARISFSFSPYAIDIAQQIETARIFGHETYIDIPLVSKNFLRADSGPRAIDLTANIDTITAALYKNISFKDTAFGGVVINPGVTDAPQNLEPFLKSIRDRGLLVLDATDDLNISITKVDGLATRRIDLDARNLLDKGTLLNELKQIEFIAMEKGSAVVLIDPRPMTIQTVKDWVESFTPQISYEERKAQGITEIEKPFALVPLSDVVTE